MEKLPVVDISGLFGSDDHHKSLIADELGHVFHQYGFVGVKGHHLPKHLISKVREQVVAFFALPMEDKLNLSIRPNNYRGYIPLRFFTPNAKRHDADNYEGYKLHFEVDSADPIRNLCALYGPNRWPSQRPGLQEVVSEYWRHCDRITSSILRALASHLAIPYELFDRTFEKPLTNMTLLKYPAMPLDDASFGIHPHKDTDVLTILAPDKVGGLFLKPLGAQDWLEAKVPADTLIVNVGDMLETWSNGYLISTPHKVENKRGLERYSFPYFAVPRYDTVIEPLTVVDSPMPTLGSAGEISRKIWHSNWPDAAPIDDALDPYSR